MLIVTHEMKFAQDVSTRVLYMDECGIYEDGTPAEIFTNPQKPKTRAFINKIRSFYYEIDPKTYDLYEFNAKLEMFCKQQMLLDKVILKLQLLSEELIFNILPKAQIAYTVEYVGASNKIILTAKYRGDNVTPLNGANPISEQIIKTSCSDITHSYEDGTNTIVLTTL